ncbi:MAG: HD domain-containing protein [Candidatus Eisenbacteria bacterium]|nr:HD domain-containing protein [Candidatus Eisenbacteria bacterium]
MKGPVLSTILAVESIGEVADWLRDRGASLGLDVEVRGDLGEARERLGTGPRYLAGYFGREVEQIPRDSGGKGTAVIPFTQLWGSPEDRIRRWDLFLRGVRRRVAPFGDNIDSLGRWVDARFEEDLHARHRELIERLGPVFSDLERRDPTVPDHSFRVGIYAARIGESLGLPPLQIRLLQLGGWVHDVGKIRIRTRTLRKRGALDPDEKRSMRFHPVWGSEMVEEQPVEREVFWMVRHHHERYDGDGYPEFLRGENIPILARVLAVADSYDAITSDRPYRCASDHRAAVREILSSAGGQFDPAVVQSFLTARLDRVPFRSTSAA